MQAVSGIAEFDDIGNRTCGLVRGAFRQQVRQFVLIPQQPYGRGIRLMEHDVSDDSEACSAPSGHELVRMGPAVKRDAEAVAAQYSVRLGKGRLEPAIISVVQQRPAVARAITCEIRRGGAKEDQALWVHAAARPALNEPR